MAQIAARSPYCDKSVSYFFREATVSFGPAE